MDSELKSKLEAIKDDIPAQIVLLVLSKEHKKVEVLSGGNDKLVEYLFELVSASAYSAYQKGIEYGVAFAFKQIEGELKDQGFNVGKLTPTFMKEKEDGTEKPEKESPT